MNWVRYSQFQAFPPKHQRRKKNTIVGHGKQKCLFPSNSLYCVVQYFQIVAYANKSKHFHLWEFWPWPSSLFCLSFHTTLSGLSPCMSLLIAFCWVLCSMSYRVRGFHWGKTVLLALTSLKVIQKGTKLSGGTRKAPRRSHLQFKGKLANQTLCHCQGKLMLKKIEWQVFNIENLP